ncbi:inhibitor of nuclear factor kappa-B kinase subunit epsilon-like [Amphibalanus amphitrite]|uniref:inhibitor of nuclear factor kappa-B kinase subunit epsilon-like n=1 Tax=Amphibalanus amphitrite TaxID=1232801 RepID=UPI001C914949|nr:inhibitor of nuclear factor kappa-B kinase subunit epsilon-like [Amphibalanus amphitrite]XP_043219532.1 inhibitor of nuclear factor kappa-B kinase subunit epsilon-like [Amphibalanus amphitrite]
MTFLRGSQNYVWCTTSVLGKGATGAVFQGVNKQNGEPVAVKTFNQLSHMRPHEVQMREFDVLKKVNHKNIVKLLAIEEEQEGRGKVIVMELCTGGSLFNMLDDPENAYGLDEKEFFLVLRHLSDGMKHLRDLNLVHRDLKPGNIMKYIDIDGSTIYKLTDFGAARELDDDQQFMSLYGTEEYLHPDMYERAVLRKSAGKTFRATVDLWSIGVTLYHVATGQLPFRPFGGRKNKETMHVITTKKKPGIISGIQSAEGGEIEWGEKLPDTCQLSLGAKSLVTPLLAGLLEVDQQVMWTFDKFFDEVTAMTSRRCVPVFHVNQLQHLRLYLHRDDSYESLQSAITTQTGISPTGQLLLLSGQPLLEVVAADTTVSRYPEIAADQPLVLFDKHNNDVTPCRPVPLPKFPTIPSTLSVENDAILAKMACNVGYEFKRRVTNYSLSCSLMEYAVSMFTSVLKTELTRLKESLESCQHLSDTLRRQWSLLATSQQTSAALLGRHQDGHRPAADALSQLSEPLQRLEQTLETVAERERGLSETNIPELHRRIVGETCLLVDWRGRVAHLPPLATAPARAATFTAKLRDSWQHLLRDRTARTLTYNDEQFHHLEKIKLTGTSKSLQQLLDGEVAPTHNSMAELLSDWYKTAQTKYIKKEIAATDLVQLESLVDELGDRLADLQDRYTACVRPVLGGGSGSTPPRPAAAVTRSPKVLREDGRRLASGLGELEDAQADIWQALQENEQLVSQLQNLVGWVVQSSLPPQNSDVIMEQ